MIWLSGWRSMLMRCQGAARLGCALARQVVVQGSPTAASAPPLLAMSRGSALLSPMMNGSNRAVRGQLLHIATGPAWSGPRGLPCVTTASLASRPGLRELPWVAIDPLRLSSLRSCTTLVEERPPCGGGAAPGSKLTAPVPPTGKCVSVQCVCGGGRLCPGSRERADGASAADRQVCGVLGRD